MLPHSGWNRGASGAAALPGFPTYRRGKAALGTNYWWKLTPIDSKLFTLPRFCFNLILLRYDRVELLLPLRPATPREGDHRDYGAMEVAITYTDDYVGQGWGRNLKEIGKARAERVKAWPVVILGVMYVVHGLPLPCTGRSAAIYIYHGARALAQVGRGAAGPARHTPPPSCAQCQPKGWAPDLQQFAPYFPPRSSSVPCLTPSPPLYRIVSRYLFGLFCGLTPPPWFKLLSWFFSFCSRRPAPGAGKDPAIFLSLLPSPPFISVALLRVMSRWTQLFAPAPTGRRVGGRASCSWYLRVKRLKVKQGSSWSGRRVASG